MGDNLRNLPTLTHSADARPGVASRLKKYALVVANHTAKHTGVGIVCAVAYFDPYVFSPLDSQHGFLIFLDHSGNCGVDLQAGSQFGYKLLFILLLAGIFAVFLQASLGIFRPNHNW